MLLTLFVTESGIQVQDLQPKPVKSDALMWLCIPFVYYLKNVMGAPRVFNFQYFR